MKMEEIMMELFKISPTLAICGLIWWKYNKDKDLIFKEINEDYNELLKNVRIDYKERETKYQNTIEKLADKFILIEDIKLDVKDIKKKLNTK